VAGKDGKDNSAAVAKLQVQIDALVAAVAAVQAGGSGQAGPAGPGGPQGPAGPAGPAGPPGTLDLSILKKALADCGITVDVVDASGNVLQSQFVAIGATLKLQLSPVPKK
jgi:hypothetical protein